ncbi:L,D-transpeptidase family protein, partial [Patulibacter sp. S7RM1-6]
AALLGLPTLAHAQAPAPAPAAAPVPATIAITTEKARDGQALKGDAWRALVVMDRFVDGAKAKISFRPDGKKRIVRKVAFAASKDGTKGVARLVVPAGARGASRVGVRATVIGHGAVQAKAAKVRYVRQLTPSVAAGARGPAVRLLQGMLAKKGYVIGQKGVYDARTQRAVLAFRKVTGMAKTQQANRAVFTALRAGKGTFKVRFPQHGRHVEGDIGRQVLALIDKGKAVRIYHTSPGAPATPTIRGSFRVYRKDPGTNAKGMYKSSYFIRGYAVHGYPSVPTYNASHGCFRVPMADADAIYAWITMGMRVDTY